MSLLLVGHFEGRFIFFKVVRIITQVFVEKAIACFHGNSLQLICEVPEFRCTIPAANIVLVCLFVSLLSCAVAMEMWF